MPTSPPPSRAGGDLGHITDHGTIRTVLLELQAGTSTYKGDWSSGSAYAVGDQVSYGGLLWSATATQSPGTVPSFVQSSDSGNVASGAGGTTLTAHGSASAGNKQLLFVTCHASVTPTLPTGWTLLAAPTTTHDRLSIYYRDVTAGNVASNVVISWADRGRAVMRTYTSAGTPALLGSGSGLVANGYTLGAGFLVRSWGSAENNGSSFPPTKTLTAPGALTNVTGPAVYDWFEGVITGDDPTASGGTAPSRTATNTGGGNTFPQFADVFLPTPGSFNSANWKLMALPDPSAQPNGTPLTVIGGTYALPPTGPTVRGGKLTLISSASSVNATLPTGTIAGDTLIGFASHGFVPSLPSGATLIAGGTPQPGIAFWKVATSTDITNGYVAISFSGSFSGQAGIVSLTGANASPIRSFAIKFPGVNSVSYIVVTPGAASPGDQVISFFGERCDGNVGGAITPAYGTVLDQRVADTGSGGVLSAQRAVDTNRGMNVFDLTTPVNSGASTTCVVTVKA